MFSVKQLDTKPPLGRCYIVTTEGKKRSIAIFTPGILPEIAWVPDSYPVAYFYSRCDKWEGFSEFTIVNALREERKKNEKSSFLLSS